MCKYGLSDADYQNKDGLRYQPTVGGSNGKLIPTDTTTRAEMAQVLYNLLSK